MLSVEIEYIMLSAKCHSNPKSALTGRIFSHVRPLYERAMSDLYRSMHRSLWVWVAHSLFLEGLHMTKNTASAFKASNSYRTHYNSLTPA
jgi:hypothetical protein